MWKVVAILATLVVNAVTAHAQNIYDLYANTVFAFAAKGKDECTPIKLNDLEVSACRGARGTPSFKLETTFLLHFVDDEEMLCKVTITGTFSAKSHTWTYENDTPSCDKSALVDERELIWQRRPLLFRIVGIIEARGL